MTGFQIIAQSSNSSKVHKLHVNQSMDLQTPVTVEVEEDGMYQVAIFAIREGTGILNSSYVKYIEHEAIDVIITIATPNTSGVYTTTLHADTVNDSLLSTPIIIGAN